MVNYYELLEIPRDAERGAIEQAIKKTRRVWNNRANNPDAAIRAEAEQHVREIAEAEKILLDEGKREEYDQQLLLNPGNDAVGPALGSNADWEEEFFRAYNHDMNEYAAQIAQGAVNANERDGRAWFLYGEALRRCGDTQRSVNALQRAALFLPGDAGVHRQLGFAYVDVNALGEACKAFAEASRIDPGNSEFHALMANCFRMAGQNGDAVREAQTAYNMDSDNNAVRFAYFSALYEDARDAMSYNRSSGKHLITNKKQLDYVNDILKIMATTIPNDEDKGKCTSAMEEIVALAVDAETVRGGGLFRSGKPGYQCNYESSSMDTKSSGLQ